LEKHQKEEMQTRAKESAVARLEKVVAPNSKHVPITVDIRSGLPEYEILKAAEEANAKLIVIGRKTRGAWNRWILGSVTENVLEGSRWPVLVLTPEPNSCTKGFGVRKFKAQSSNNQ
jgi:nucleotide-binding universal stress UspA family protein